MSFPRVRKWIGTLFLGLVCVALAPHQSAFARTMTLNLKDADIGAVIATVAEMTGENFIIDPRVKGKVTVISSHPMEPDEVYQVFLSVLSVHGFAAIPGDGAVKIVPEVNAKQGPIPTVTANDPGRGDEYVTRVIQVDNVAAAQMVPILRPLMPQQAHLAAYPPSNVLIASGEAANVARIVEIIKRIDLEGDRGIEVIPLQHASAAEVVRILQSLEQADEKGQKAIERPTLVADERTNSILISGGEAHRLRIRAIITHLDTPLEKTGNTEVIYLNYANAPDLVPVLSGISSSITADDKTKKGANDGGKVNIQADESTNALVINAPPDIMRSLKAVVRRLDVRRAQVLVEAVIAEVSSEKANELGVQWAYDGSAQSHPVGLINFAGSGAGIANIAVQAASGTLTSPPDGATIGIGNLDGTGAQFAAFIRALAGDADTNILSTPTLVTMDNEEAEIVVGQNVPFVTGSYTSTGTGSTPTNPFQTIQRQDVGLTLKVKPQINEGNAVKLALTQEVSSISSATTGAADLVTNKRSLKTTVMVDDGQAVVLGGLVDDQLRESVQKVPGLGDLPILGQLFSYKKTSKVKRNLMVFLHPVILRDASQNALVAGAKYNAVRRDQVKLREQGVALMPDDTSPLLPTWDEYLALPPPFPENSAGQPAAADPSKTDHE